MMMGVLLVCSFLPIKAFALSTHTSEDAPVFVGVEDNGEYCKSVKFKVKDDRGIAHVKADDTTLTADEEGYYILVYNNSYWSYIESVITATDIDGNTTSVSVTVYGDHRMAVWKGDGKDIWNACIICDTPGDIRQKAPEAHVVGSDTVCRSEDYKFTVTLPNDCEFMHCLSSWWEFSPQLQDDGTYLCTIENWGDYGGQASIDIHMEVQFYPASGGYYRFAIDKTVTVIEHKGGTANCKEQAVCTECGNPYGETDPKAHKEALQHVEAKSATTEEAGNIEYWYCVDCDKYYSDKDGNTEIAKAAITVEKLGSPSNHPTPTSPATGDNSYIWLWISTMFVCATGFVSVNFFKKKKFY